MAERNGIQLNRAEGAIVQKHLNGYFDDHGDCSIALVHAVYESREHVLKTLERHIGRGLEPVFADEAAMRKFLAVIERLRRY